MGNVMLILQAYKLDGGKRRVIGQFGTVADNSRCLLAFGGSYMIHSARPKKTKPKQPTTTK